MLYEENIKKTHYIGPFKPIKCKCGSNRLKAQVAKGDYDNDEWVQIICKRCNNILFYNGA